MSPLITLIFFIRRLNKVYQILTPVKFLFLGILYWGGNKSIGLYLSEDNNNIAAIGFNQYVIVLFGTLILLTIFDRKFINNEFIYYNNKIIFNKHMYSIIFILWISISLIINYYLAFSGMHTGLSFFMVHVLQGPYLILSGGLFLIGLRSSVLISLKKIVSCLIPFIVLWSLSSGPLNRTAFILPVAFFLILVILSSIKIVKKNIFSFNNIKYVFLILLIALLSDMQRKSGIAFYELIFLPEFLLVNFYSVIQDSTFFPSSNDADNYFYSLGLISEYELFKVLGIFKQLISIFIPRIYFPDKEQTDLSMILFSQGFLPQPAYYEIFLEPFIDSGYIGNFLFYFFLIILSCKCVELLKKSINTNLQPFFLSLYVLLLISLFMVVRGPIIFLAWYLLPSILFMLLITLLSSLKKIN